MRRKVSEGRSERKARAHSSEGSWLCRCSYTNVATRRCYFCGARPPRIVRAELRSAAPYVEDAPVASDA